MSLEIPSAAAIYCRISDDRAGRALGVARQEADCRELAGRKGWAVADVYVDNDVSAADARKRRPEYERLLEDVKDGRVDAVVVWDLDRLHRRPSELERFFEIADAAGLRFLSSVSGDVDLETGHGVLVSRIKGAVAAEEVAKLRQRVRRKHRELAEAGKVSGGGTRPFGFEADRLTVRAEEAVIVEGTGGQAAVGRVAAVALCVTLKRAGTYSDGSAVDTGDVGADAVLGAAVGSAGALWRDCRSSGVAGHRVGGDDGEASGAGRGRARRTRRPPRRYLLAGLAVCGRCGARMVARPRDDGARRYVCAKGPGFVGCNGCFILAEPLEQLVAEGVMLRLDSPEFAAALSGRAQRVASEDVMAELAADEAQLDELAEAYGERVITLREYLTARKPIEARIEAARKRMSHVTGTAALEGFVGNAAQLRELWDEMSVPRRQAVVAAVLDRVVISEGVRGRNFFDPDRVTPIWRV